MQNILISPEVNLLPDGFSTRAGQLSDYLAVFDLVNAYGEHLNGHPYLTDPEVIRQDWQNPGFDPASDILVVLDAQGRMAGLLETWLVHQPPVHPWNWICVHPDYLDAGIWEYLLRHGEQRSREALQRVTEELRVAPTTGTEHHNQAGLRAAQSLGWSHIRSFYRMVADLEAAPVVPALPAGITIRPYDPATELEAVYQVMVDSFRDHFGFVDEPFEAGLAGFKHNLIEVPGYDPDYWFVAVEDGRIAGICLCRPVDLEDPQAGWVNELGVLRPWRKQGLGYALLLHAFAAFYARGQKRAALGVDASSLTGALRLYERAGMRVARQFDHFEKELRPGRELRTQIIE